MNNNKVFGWSGGYVDPLTDRKSGFPPPWSSTGYPMQNETESFLGPEPGGPEPGDFDEFQRQQRQHFRKQFTKTQLCRYHLSSGCRKGTTCEFAHDPVELTQPPDLRRTSICKDWQEGKCLATAETCRFAHGNALLRRTLEDDSFFARRSSDAPLPSTLASGSGMQGRQTTEPDRPFSSREQEARGFGMRGGQPPAARHFTNWEQRLLRQQAEQEQMKETIKEQQRTIDALLRLQISMTATAGQPAALPQNANLIQSGTEYPQPMQNVLPQFSESVQPANNQGVLNTALSLEQGGSRVIRFRC